MRMMKIGKPKPKTTPIQFRKRRNNENLRLNTLQRDDYCCQMCLQPYPEYKLECDHAIPLQQGGEDNELNTQTLCIPCHRLKTNSENNYKGK